MNCLNIDSKKELQSVDADNLIGFTLLGQYNTKDDLIFYKGAKYQPQITINIEIPLSQRYKFGISLDRNSGYRVVQITDDGETRDYTENIFQIKNAMLNPLDGSQHIISAIEAQEFILNNYECFANQNDPMGHRCYYD
ncbi:hypothetical protein [Butyrivibrio sp. M55]|uniref:hypothetical protein n=1 Tax=Butyrivibrio sp. M55 TaxID=1855323 RepID=UPI0008E25F36|nr:hypothetical protein [Butyrivibrio sp. M55]SFU89495.1 hypothetical protein SAMN05216540_11828 [Butyrivibrio sp. M55]